MIPRPLSRTDARIESPDQGIREERGRQGRPGIRLIQCEAVEPESSVDQSFGRQNVGDAHAGPQRVTSRKRDVPGHVHDVRELPAQTANDGDVTVLEKDLLPGSRSQVGGTSHSAGIIERYI